MSTASTEKVEQTQASPEQANQAEEKQSAATQSPSPTCSPHTLDYAQEKERLIKEKKLFEDPDFPAGPASLYFKEAPKSFIEWKRPSEIVKAPQFIVGGTSRFDVNQGSLGNCWFLSAVANLTMRPEVFNNVVPQDQSFSENYAGIFHFRFWRYGKWLDVVIDDRLPTVHGHLYYVHSKERNEFWVALLEKAYAKAYGTYEHLKQGSAMEAFEDFTGGLTVAVDTHKVSPAMVLAGLDKAFELGSFASCFIDSKNGETSEVKLPNGLATWHAYSITGLHRVETEKEGEVVLVRVRNPWGSKFEWNGKWNDKDEAWNQVSAEKKKELELKCRPDGEFWMAFEDFVREFDGINVCTSSPEKVYEDAAQKGAKWDTIHLDGEWKEGDCSAGGCSNYDTYCKNPQFLLEITSQDENSTVFLSLMQKYRREQKNKGKELMQIGFAVYPVPNSTGPLTNAFFSRCPRPILRVPKFTNLRQVTSMTRLPAGQYVIVPSTFQPKLEGEFLLRIFSNGAPKARRLQ